MADTIQLTLNAQEMAKYLAWCAEVETATGQPLTGLYISFVLTPNGLRQIIVRPSTEAGYPRKAGQLGVGQVR